MLEALKGENLTIFAYGQTGSGKTFTIIGSEENEGIFPKMVRTLLDAKTSQTSLTLSVIEVYNEDYFDLLQETRSKTSIFDQDQKQIFSPLLTQFRLTSPDSLASALARVLKHRKTTQTHMNLDSSRSHVVFRLSIQNEKINS